MIQHLHKLACRPKTNVPMRTSAPPRQSFSRDTAVSRFLHFPRLLPALPLLRNHSALCELTSCPFVSSTTPSASTGPTKNAMISYKSE